MINNALLQMAARGGRSAVPDAFARGAQQGNALRQFQQEQQTQNALAQIGQTFAAQGPEAAYKQAGELGELNTAMQLYGGEQDRQLKRQRLNQPMSGVGKIKADFAAGRINQDEYNAGMQALQSRVGGFMTVTPGSTVLNRATGQPVYSAPTKKKSLSPSERKETRERESNALNLDATVTRLGEAESLVDQAFSGTGAGIRGTLGTNLPDTMVPDVLADPKGARATSELSKILGLEAVQSMAQSLTGATTNFELQKFVDILADPSAPPDQKRRTIQRMKDLAANQLALEQQRIQEFEPDQVQQQQPTQPAPSPIEANTRAALQEAQEAIAAGADPQAVIQRMEEAGFDTTGLQ